MASVYSCGVTSSPGTNALIHFNDVFMSDKIIIKDINKVNSEVVKYSNTITMAENYTCVIDFNDIKLVLETTSDKFINLSFGDHQAIVCSRENIYNVIPEIN